MSDFHGLSMAAIDGTDINFARFKGTLCLVVNVASR